MTMTMGATSRTTYQRRAGATSAPVSARAFQRPGCGSAGRGAAGASEVIVVRARSAGAEDGDLFLADLLGELFPDLDAKRVGRHVLGALEQTCHQDVRRDEDRRIVQ